MNRKQNDRLTFARRVTRWHGATFATELLGGLLETEVPYEVFGETGVIAWPVERADETPAKVRYRDLEDEILERTFDAARSAISEAFVNAAREVIDRERKQQQRRKRQS